MGMLEASSRREKSNRAIVQTLLNVNFDVGKTLHLAQMRPGQTRSSNIGKCDAICSQS